MKHIIIGLAIVALVAAFAWGLRPGAPWLMPHESESGLVAFPSWVREGPYADEFAQFLYAQRTERNRRAMLEQAVEEYGFSVGECFEDEVIVWSGERHDLCWPVDDLDLLYPSR